MESICTEQFRKEGKYGNFHQSDIGDGLCKSPKTDEWDGMLDCTAELSLYVSPPFIHPVLFHSPLNNAY